VCLIFELHTASHNKTVKTVFAKYDPSQYNVVRAINSGRDLFTTGLAMRPDTLSALNTAILERCREARHLRVETPSGTSLRVELDNSRFRWLSNRGVGRPGKFLVIPPGEVATFPAKIDGTLVADFAINVNMYYDDDARLGANPVTAEIRDGRLAGYHCASPAVSDFLRTCFGRPNALRVGELGFGTNKAVQSAVPENSHLNERVPGVHIGFGAHNQTEEATGYSCDVHVDLCAQGGLIWFDNSPEPIDLANLTPSANPHPPLVNNEDIFSDDAEEDCCGTLT
jgi:leucyl aminopeptidase (aminopeptidase T)